MKRFINLVITNMANVIKPMIILAMVTIVLQVGLYSFNLVTREDYKENVNTMEMADEEDVICYRTVEFITEKEMNQFEEWTGLEISYILSNLLVNIICTIVYF